MKKNTLALAICLLFLIGCPSPQAPAPPVLAPCLGAGSTLGVTVIGTGVNLLTSIPTDIRTTATLSNTAATNITWTTGGASAPDNPISGTGGTGNVTLVAGSAPPQYTVNISYTVDGKTITITGTITFSDTTPPTCSGSGTWTAVNQGGVNLGSGQWTIP